MVLLAGYSLNSVALWEKQKVSSNKCPRDYVLFCMLLRDQPQLALKGIISAAEVVYAGQAERLLALKKIRQRLVPTD
jgi:uncharacterized protein YbcI